MSDESELNRLRADLEKFASLSLRYRADVQIRDHQNYLRNKIAELEAAADPWRKHKELMDIWRGSYSKGFSSYGMAVEIYDHLTAEVARLTARVGELDAEIEKYKDAGVTIANEFWVNELSGFIDDMQPPFEGPIEGPELALEPARVLATAAEILKMIRDKAPSLHPVEGLLQRAIFAVEQYSRYGRHEYPMHYKLKGPAK